MKKVPTGYVLGRLCKRGHDWENTGKTLYNDTKAHDCKLCHVARRKENPSYAIVGAKWTKDNMERVNKKQRIWRKANPEKTKRYAKKWQKNNPEKMQVIRKRCGKRYREKHGEQIKQKGAKWRKDNPKKQKERCRRQGVVRQKERDELSDNYIKLKLGGKISTKDNSFDSLLEIKRVHLKIKRFIKERKDAK